MVRWAKSQSYTQENLHLNVKLPFKKVPGPLDIPTLKKKIHSQKIIKRTLKAIILSTYIS